MSDWKNIQYKNGKMRTSEGGGGGGSSTFAGLDDVNFSNLQNGQVPKYNSTTEKWENADESGGGSSSADDVSYDNTTSGMTATNVQDAIDEIAQDFQDGCDIISQAVIAKGQTPASNSPTDIANAISQISGGRPFTYDLGDYFGDKAGTNTTSLSITLLNRVGTKCLLIIMHRDTITVPNVWTLVDNKKNNQYNQWISIYSKIVESSSESYTITQATSARMCACTFYIPADKNLIYYDEIAMNPSATNYQYVIPALNCFVLSVMSNVYSGSGQFTTSPNVSLDGIKSYDTDTFRLAAVITSFIGRTFTIDHAVSYDSTSGTYNRLWRYKIE